MPVALNLYKIRDAKDEGNAFFRSVQAQKTQYQGFWLVTWDGHVLASPLAISRELPPNQSDWPKMMLADLKSGMNEFGTIAPRHVSPTDPLPYRGVGVRPDGGVTLAVTDKLIVVQDLTPNLPPGAIAAINLDSVTLSAAEWSALAPPDTRAESQWIIPQAVGRRFFPLLSPTDKVFQGPGEVTEVQLAGRVFSVRDGIASLIYGGRIAGTYHGAKSEGMEGRECCSALKIIGAVGAYDIRAREMLSLTWVWDGRFWGYHNPSDHDQRQSRRFGAVIEWHQGDAKAAAQLKAKASRPETKVELADSTPEDALKTFLLALAAQDETTLRAVALSDAELDLLLRGPRATADQLARLKARLEEKPMRRLKAGDTVTMPDGERRVIKPNDVRESRVVLWPDGEPLPTRLENVGGHWKVFAATFIAARK